MLSNLKVSLVDRLTALMPFSSNDDTKKEIMFLGCGLLNYSKDYEGK